MINNYIVCLSFGEAVYAHETHTHTHPSSYTNIHTRGGHHAARLGGRGSVSKLLSSRCWLRYGTVCCVAREGSVRLRGGCVVKCWRRGALLTQPQPLSLSLNRWQILGILLLDTVVRVKRVIHLTPK